MAVRPDRICSTVRSLTTATAVLVASTVAPVFHAAAARADWDDGPSRSVLADPSALPVGEGEILGPEAAALDPAVVTIDDSGLASTAVVGDEFAVAGEAGGPSFYTLPQFLDDCARVKKACWIGRADALLLWRNAPPDRPILTNDLLTAPALNANGMQSTPAAGPRFSVFRVNPCTGNGIEATYLRAANFRSIRPLADVGVPYVVAPPGIYGNDTLTFDSGNANLGSRLQSFELNRHVALARDVRFLAGFRWIEWQEEFSFEGQTLGGITDSFLTNCYNDLYGGQIGLDANLIGWSWLRIDGLVKAGAYYNTAVQSSAYTTNDPANPGTATVTAGDEPLSCAFAGEVGLTGVIPITCCLDVRIGYFGLWLSGIAQPTQQLSGQQLNPDPAVPVVGTINANGGVLVQGVSLGLEGRW